MKEGERQREGNFIATTLNGRVADKIKELSNSPKKAKNKNKIMLACSNSIYSDAHGTNFKVLK